MMLPSGPVSSRSLLKAGKRAAVPSARLVLGPASQNQGTGQWLLQKIAGKRHHCCARYRSVAQRPGWS